MLHTAHLTHTEFLKQDRSFVIARSVKKKDHFQLLITSEVKEEDFYKTTNSDQCHGERTRNEMSECNWGGGCDWLILLGMCTPLNLVLPVMEQVSLWPVSYVLYQKKHMRNCQADIVAWVEGLRSGQIQFTQRAKEHRKAWKVSLNKVIQAPSAYKLSCNQWKEVRV